MKILGVYLQSLLYILAGLNHFRKPGPYVSIMPHWIPWHPELIVFSGIMEIVLGIGLLIPATRNAAAAGIILLLIAVFPANIQMAIDYFCSGHPGKWLTIIRLPVQLVLIYWAWRYTRWHQS